MAGNKAGLFYVASCSELMEQLSFSESKTSSILRCEGIINSSARASCTRKLLHLFCKEKRKKSLFFGIDLIREFSKQCLIITKTCF